MSICKYISALELQKMQKTEQVVIIDIREPGEYVRDHIVNSRNIPLPKLSKETIGKCREEDVIVFYCQSGNRTRHSQNDFLNLGLSKVHILKNGINDWKKIKGKTLVNIKTPLPIMRQVQIIVGFMVVLGVTLSYFITPYFNLLSAFFGAGLLFAGISGYCGMANALMTLPYNKPKR